MKILGVIVEIACRTCRGRKTVSDKGKLVDCPTCSGLGCVRTRMAMNRFIIAVKRANRTEEFKKSKRS